MEVRWAKRAEPHVSARLRKPTGISACTYGGSMSRMMERCRVILVGAVTTLAICIVDTSKAADTWRHDGTVTTPDHNAWLVTSTIKDASLSLEESWTQNRTDSQMMLFGAVKRSRNSTQTTSMRSSSTTKTESMNWKSDLYSEDQVQEIVELRLQRRRALRAMRWVEVKRLSLELFEQTRHYGYMPWV